MSPLLTQSLGYAQLGNDQKAIEAAQSSLTFARKTQNPGTQNISVLGLGLTNQVPGFASLPNVQTELDGIVRKSTTDSKGIFPGKMFCW